MKTYLQYIITCSNQEEKDTIVAVLSTMGFDGFEEEPEQLKATIIQNLLDREAVEKWLSENGYRFATEEIPEQNWNALWESSFSPVVVDDFAAVRAFFHEPIPQVSYELIITPKMSFGTGHHATTNLMIRAMKTLPIKGNCVFDFGTGTGILAILAAKMGAAKVEAVDNDSWSIANAQENIENNGAGDTISLWLDDTPGKAGMADVILANINKHIILRFMPALCEKLTDEGYLVLSGLLRGDEDEIDAEASKIGMVKIKESELNNWISLVYRRMNFVVK